MGGLEGAMSRTRLDANGVHRRMWRYRQAGGASALNVGGPQIRGPLLLSIFFGPYREFAQQCFSDRDRGRAAELGRFAVDSVSDDHDSAIDTIMSLNGAPL